jgi:predicted TIM-barrel fold metal-dependent hydrolase
MRILAHHAHVFPEVINPNGTIPRLERLMEACGISQAICFAPFPHQCDGKDIEPLQWLAGELKSRPHLYGFGTIDFRRPDVREQVFRARDMGMKGLKLHPNAQSFAILEPRAYAVYGAAEEAGLYCTFHSGVHHSRLKDTRVLDFDQVAWDFPRLRFSLEHVGGYSFFTDALAVIFNHVPPPWEQGRANVFGGLTSVFTTKTNRMWHLTDAQIMELIAQVGARQVHFGLDFPYNLEEETRIGIDRIRRLEISEEEKALILGGNLRRELGIE